MARYNDYDSSKLNAGRITLLIGCIAMIVVLISIVVSSNITTNKVKAISLEESANSINNVTVEVAKVEEPEILIEEVDDVKAMITASVIDPYSIVEADIEKMKNGDSEVIEKYFGFSDIFTPEILGDRLSVATVKHIETLVTDDNMSEIYMHICTIDYNKMNNDFLSIEAAEKEKYDESVEGGVTPEVSYTDKAMRSLGEKLLDGEYDVCYNVSIFVDSDGNVKPTEAFKQAITGGWYVGAGIELSAANCH